MSNFKELVDVKQAKWKGIPTRIFFSLLLVTLLVMFIPDSEGIVGGYIRNNFLISFSMLAIIAIFFGEIGDRIPVWNEYVGGGTILVFFIGSLLATYQIFPEVFIEQADFFYDGSGMNFLELFIPALIVGSVLTVNRKILIRSFIGYIPLIIIGVMGASVCAIGVGFIFGKEPVDIMLNYVLPIMGGGTGAGATPMSEMYASTTGGSANDWFGFAISILTIANIFAIFTAGALNAIGKKNKGLTGNGQLLMVNQDSIKAQKEEWESVESSQETFFVGIVFIGIVYLASHFLSEIWAIFGPQWLQLHRLAVLVIVAIILNVLDVVPPKVKAGCKHAQTFFTKFGLWILMLAVGMGTDFQEILRALTISNVFIALAVVLGATFAIMATSKFLKFYPIEAAITAGLCMANRGGSGDVAVLGAADRMELMSFAQISSRIGGAMMLVFAGILFSLFA